MGQQSYELTSQFGGFMWTRRKPRTMESDLGDAADDLKLAVDQLLNLSVQLVDSDNKAASQRIARLILSLQDDERILRKHAENLKSGSFGRRAGDRRVSAD